MLAVMQVNASHGLSLSKFVTNLEYAGLFTAPVWALGLWRPSDGRPWPRDLRVGVAALFITFVLVSSVASKPGAGNWHLLPFVPITLWLAAQSGRAWGKPAQLPPYAVLAWSATVAFLGWTRHDDWVTYLWRNDAAQQAQEVHAIMTSHPTQPVMMGAGQSTYGAGYYSTFVRPVLVYAGQPYTFDPAAIMDLRKASRPDDICASSRMWGSWRDLLMLIPHGEAPFSMANNYGGLPCFPENFRLGFEQDFKKISEGQWFDVWARRSNSAIPFK